MNEGTDSVELGLGPECVCVCVQYCTVCWCQWLCGFCYKEILLSAPGEFNQQSLRNDFMLIPSNTVPKSTAIFSTAWSDCLRTLWLVYWDMISIYSSSQELMLCRPEVTSGEGKVEEISFFYNKKRGNDLIWVPIKEHTRPQCNYTQKNERFTSIDWVNDNG